MRYTIVLLVVLVVMMAVVAEAARPRRKGRRRPLALTRPVATSSDQQTDKPKPSKPPPMFKFRKVFIKLWSICTDDTVKEGQLADICATMQAIANRKRPVQAPQKDPPPPKPQNASED